MEHQFYLAPLQGFTKVWYRNAFQNALGGADKYFTPFFEEHKSGGFDPRLLPELDTGLNSGTNLIPQVATSDVAFLSKFWLTVTEMGYPEINLNMGCPFPMLVRRHRGGGLMNQPEMVKSLLGGFFEIHPNAKLSVKMRSGLNDTKQGAVVIDVLNLFPLTELIIHPRLVTQQYNGTPDWNAFESIAQKSIHPIVANGDINHFDDWQALSDRFQNISRWMMGRGWLMNPTLASEIKNGLMTRQERLQNLWKFHQTFYALITAQKQMAWQLKNQYLNQFWHYPSQQIENGSRWLRRLKKENRPETYLEYIRQTKDFFTI